MERILHCKSQAAGSWKSYFVAPTSHPIPVHPLGCDRCPALGFTRFGRGGVCKKHPPQTSKAWMLRNLRFDLAHAGEGLEGERDLCAHARSRSRVDPHTLHYRRLRQFPWAGHNLQKRRVNASALSHSDSQLTPARRGRPLFGICAVHVQTRHH